MGGARWHNAVLPHTPRAGCWNPASTLCVCVRRVCMLCLCFRVVLWVLWFPSPVQNTCFVCLCRLNGISKLCV